jgi:hypothetical protein
MEKRPQIEEQVESSCDKSAIVSTVDILRKFPREDLALVNVQKAERLRDRTAEQYQQRTLKNLRTWAVASTRIFSLWKTIDFKSWHVQSSQKPHLDRLIALTKYHFPPCGKTSVQVFDFGSDHAQKSICPLGEIEKGMYHQEKPCNNLLTKFSHERKAQLGHSALDVRYSSLQFVLTLLDMPPWVLDCFIR